MKLFSSWRNGLTGIALLLPPLFSHASTAEGWQLSLALGQGKVSTPLAGRDEIAGNILPGISYYGERFYLENTHLGYTLLEHERGYVDLVGELNDDGMFFELDGVNNFGWWDALGIGRTDNTETGNPPDSFQDIERHLSYMAGLSATAVWQEISLRAAYLKEMTGVHHGEVMRLSLRHDLVFGEHLTLRLQAIAERKDQRLLNYYYNVRPYELNNSPSWFTLDAAWNFSYGASMNYQLDPSWSLLIHWQHHQMDTDLQLTPLIRRLDYQSKFVGLRYLF